MSYHSQFKKWLEGLQGYAPTTFEHLNIWNLTFNHMRALICVCPTTKTTGCQSLHQHQCKSNNVRQVGLLKKSSSAFHKSFSVDLQPIHFHPYHHYCKYYHHSHHNYFNYHDYILMIIMIIKVMVLKGFSQHLVIRFPHYSPQLFLHKRQNIT